MLKALSRDYAETTGTNEFGFLDTSAAAEHRADQAEYNKELAFSKLLV